MHNYLLSFPSFWALSIERFLFLLRSIVNGVTMKTSNSKDFGNQSLRFPHWKACHRPHIAEKTWLNVFDRWGLHTYPIQYEEGMHYCDFISFEPSPRSLFANCPRDQVKAKGKQNAGWEARKIPRTHFLLALRKN